MMPRDNRDMYMAHVFMYVVVTVWGLWECCVAAVVENNVLALDC